MDEQDGVTSDWLAKRLTGASAPTIAADIAVLIRRGILKGDALLPPVRAFAARLKVSPSTVSAAWTKLKQLGLITGRGRGGTRVVAHHATPFPARYQANPHYDPTVALDLSVSVPDVTLLPDMRRALRHVGNDGLNSYQRERITPPLEAAARPTWPYPAQSMLAANAGYEGIRLALSTFVRPGDWVVLESPSLPRILDIADVVGARVLFAERDEQGVSAEAVARYLDLAPAAIVLQPGVNNPAGSSMTAQRAEELATVLTGTDVLIVEVDQQNALFDDPIAPLAALTDENRVYIRSYSKSHGPDLRTAIVEGPEAVIGKIHAYLGFGSGWTSRVLQNGLAWMLRDPASQAQIANAATVYRGRARLLRDALLQRGLTVSPGAGLEVTVEVRDEQYASGYLHSAGVAVALGSTFTEKPSTPWIRVSTGTLREDHVETLADQIAAAAR